MREKLFWNFIAKKYSKDTISNMKGYEQSLEFTRKYLNKKQKVLELGCGTSSTALLLAKDVKEYVATDISSKMIEIGAEKVKKSKIKNITLFQADSFDEKLEKNSYDVVLAFNLLHLVKDKEAVIKHVHSLLKPDGVFISKTVCMGGDKKMSVIAFLLQFLIGPIKCFNSNEYRTSFTNNGFKIVKEHIHKEDSPIRSYIVAKKK